MDSLYLINLQMIQNCFFVLLVRDFRVIIYWDVSPKVTLLLEQPQVQGNIYCWSLMQSAKIDLGVSFFLTLRDHKFWVCLCMKLLLCYRRNFLSVRVSVCVFVSKFVINFALFLFLTSYGQLVRDKLKDDSK